MPPSPDYLAGVRAGLKAAERVAAAHKRNANLCPYGNDKPGDLTWNHTEEDLCPVCKASANNSLHLCTDTIRGQIIAAIRSLDPAAMKEEPDMDETRTTPATEWKAGDPAMVVLIEPAPFGRCWRVKDANNTEASYSVVQVSALHPLPAAAAEDAAVLREILIEDMIAACTGCGSMEFPRDPRCDSCVAAVDDRIAEAVRNRRAKESAVETKPHPICDNPARYDRGQCCGRTPCTDAATPEPPATPKTTPDLAALRERLANSALACWIKTGSPKNDVIGVWQAMYDDADALNAALAPPDPVKELREAASIVRKELLRPDDNGGVPLSRILAWRKLEAALAAMGGK